MPSRRSGPASARMAYGGGYTRMHHKIAVSLHDRISSSRWQCCAGLAVTAPACFPRRRHHRRRRGLAPHAAVTLFLVTQR
jgi:hypothetical protein